MKHGYSFLRYMPFNWKDPETYLSVFIRFFDNIWTGLLRKPYCKYSHAGNFCLYNGELWVYEAVKQGFCRTYKVDDYFKVYSKCSFLILKPKFNFDSEKFTQSCKKLCGTKYDIIGLAALAEYLATDETLYIGRENEKMVVCTTAIATNYHNSTDGSIFPKPYKITPIDLFTTTLFSRTIYKN